MKNLAIACATLSLFVLAASPVGAQTGYHGGMDGKPPHGMMMRDGSCMEMMDRTCPSCGMAMNGMGMAAGSMREMHGMMMGGTAPSFYLDMKEDLGLEQRQIEQLRDIRREFRKDFVRRAAELKISKMELEDVFQGDWTVDAAEKQLRQIQKLQADLAVRYLEARKKAEQVLTAEQLRMVRGMMDE